MTYGKTVTGTRDEVYDLISTLYHALQGAETYVYYTEDADYTGDRELAQFFKEVQEEDRQRAHRAKELLRKHLARDLAEDAAGNL